jgi:hypothetical protein
MYTAWCQYYATGEGITHMVLIHPANSEEDLKERFSEVFGEYYAIGMEFKKGIYFDFPGNGYVISNGIRNTYETWKKNGTLPMNEYFSSFHVNLS